MPASNQCAVLVVFLSGLYAKLKMYLNLFHVKPRHYTLLLALQIGRSQPQQGPEDKFPGHAMHSKKKINEPRWYHLC